MDINQITIQVFDVEKSIEFYKKLGLTLIVKSIPTYARFECENGKTTFSLHQTEKENNENRIWVYFETDELDKKVDELVLKGFEFEEMPTDKPWLWREARLKDLDNNQLIIYYAGKNRQNPPWRIKE
nr:VOC family protein [uncultured Flavobacterium sp.]